MNSDVAADARQQIHDALCAYARGIDRLDADSVRRAFHPGALLIDYGSDPITVESFAEYAVVSLQTKYSTTQHRITNTFVEFDDDDVASGAATVESYVLAFHIEPADPDAGTDELLHTFNGRWIDRFTLVDGRWRCSQRTLRNDWSSVASLGTPMRGTWPKSGRGGTPDPLDS